MTPHDSLGGIETKNSPFKPRERIFETARTARAGVAADVTKTFALRAKEKTAHEMFGDIARGAGVLAFGSYTALMGAITLGSKVNPIAVILPGALTAYLVMGGFGKKPTEKEVRELAALGNPTGPLAELINRYNIRGRGWVETIKLFTGTKLPQEIQRKMATGDVLSEQERQTILERVPLDVRSDAGTLLKNPVDLKKFVTEMNGFTTSRTQNVRNTVVASGTRPIDIARGIMYS